MTQAITRHLHFPRRTPRSASLGLLLGVAALLTQVALAGPLDREIERFIRNTNLGGGTGGVYIADLDTGEELASYRSDEPMVPASTMKLLTTGAALQVLGNDFTFRTRLILDETVSPPILIVKGDGDPALGDPAIFIGETPGVELSMLFDQIGQALKAVNVAALSGIVIDDRVFDRNFTHPDWPEDQLNRWYCAQVGGLNFNTNVINIYTQPSRSGTPSVRMEPDAYWVLLNIKAKSITESRDTAWVSRPTKSNAFTVHGNVSSKSEIPVAIDTPPLFAGRVLADALSVRGITLGDESQSAIDTVRLVELGEHLEESRIVAIITTPMPDVLRRVNTNSYNLYAEALLKRIGHEITSDPGSWENGAAVLRMTLAEQLGAEAAESTIISDGSGMSRENRVTAQTFVRWLRMLSRSEHWDTFAASLATPGEGTLRQRFTKNDMATHIIAKSGYLTGTYALCGVLQHPRSGQRVAFSIMLNDVRAGSTAANAKPLIDDIVEEIDQYMSERAGDPAMGG